MRIAAALGVLLMLIAVPLVYNSRLGVKYRGLRTVEDGVLYRSGQLEMAALERCVREYGIKTIITFRDESQDKDGPSLSTQEEEYCERNDLVFKRLPWTYWSSPDGAAPPIEKNIREFMQVVRERRAEGPILIHCFAGIHRTGAFAALYRMEFNGWSNQEAIEEMQDRGYVTLKDDHDILNYLLSYKPSQTNR